MKGHSREIRIAVVGILQSFVLGYETRARDG